MERRHLKELHYITPIANLPSILEHGILSHNAAERFSHESIANERVQQIRASRIIYGLPLHSYVNLFLNARNAMMMTVTDNGTELEGICVLSVSTSVLDIENVIITNDNAAKMRTSFVRMPMGLARLNRKDVYAMGWNHPARLAMADSMRELHAEVLVPDCVGSDYIKAIYIPESRPNAVNDIDTNGIDVVAHGFLFFDGRA